MIYLSSNTVYPWAQSDSFNIKGNSKLFPKGTTATEAEKYLRESVTGFAWIHESKEEIVACTDTIRSFPLFYYFDGQDFAISDDANLLKKELEIKALNRLAFHEFNSFGFVLGNETLIEDLFVLGPCERLSFNKETKHLSVANYSQIKPKSNTNIDYSIKLKNVLDVVFERVIESLNDRTAVIPLSAGYDSRLILAAMVQKGYQNIVCYTYGKPDSYEVKAAKEITEQLKVTWHFIEYTDEIFDTYFDEEGLNYEGFASQYVSIAHEQDFFAVRAMKKEGKIPNDAVFIPGFCADVLAGSMIDSTKVKPVQSWFEYVCSKFFPSGYQIEPSLENRFMTIYPAPINKKSEVWQEAYEKWYTETKLSKFVTNSVRSFEFEGYSWLLPYWDIHFIDFWKQVPVDLRKNRKLYYRCLNKQYFEPLGINIKVNSWDKKIEESIILKPLKQLAPQKLKDVVKNVLNLKNENDVNNLDAFARALIKNEPNISGEFINENHVHAVWLLYKLQNGKKPFLDSTSH